MKQLFATKQAQTSYLTPHLLNNCAIMYSFTVLNMYFLYIVLSGVPVGLRMIGLMQVDNASRPVIKENWKTMGRIWTVHIGAKNSTQTRQRRTWTDETTNKRNVKLWNSNIDVFEKIEAINMYIDVNGQRCWDSNRIDVVLCNNFLFVFFNERNCGGEILVKNSWARIVFLN